MSVNESRFSNQFVSMFRLRTKKSLASRLVYVRSTKMASLVKCSCVVVKVSLSCNELAVQCTSIAQSFKASLVCVLASLMVFNFHD